MANKVGPLIREARSKAGLSQEALAKKVDGLSAAELGKAERGEKELSQAVLRQIAKATGVTQSSLIEAAKASSYGGAAKKPASAAKKTATSRTSSAAKKTASAASKSRMELSAAEKKLVELYRAADSDTKKSALAVLKGEKSEAGDLLSTLIGSAVEMLGKK